jgi:restriction system protein
MNEFPKREFFFKPVIHAIQELGGSGSNEEINNKVIEMLKISEKLLAVMHKNTTQTEFEYQMAWVRTMLKSQGLLENSQRGVWSIRSSGDFSMIKFQLNKQLEFQINE